MQSLGVSPAQADPSVFRIEDVMVKPDQNMLLHAGRHHPLEAKTMGVLTYLANHAGAVVAREDLLDAVWGELGGSDESLSRAISLCRSAFAQLEAPNPIRTVPRRGYTLIAEVIRESGGSQRHRAAAPAARALYLQGRTKAARIAGPTELAEAVSMLKQATELDPTFASGWSALAQAQAIAAGHTPFGDRLAQIRAAGESAEHAIVLDYRQHLAHTVRAQRLLAERDILHAIEAAEIARAIAPEDADAAMWLGYIFAVIGLFDRALPLLETAVALDPLQGRRHMILAVTYVAKGELAAGEQAALQAIGLGFFGAQEPYATAAYLRGQPDQAQARFEDALNDFSRVYARDPRFRPLLQLAAKGVYCQSAICRKLLLSAAISIAAVWKGAPEGILAYIFLRTGSPARFIASFGTRILPGNSILLPYLWDASESAGAVRNAASFRPFARRIGFEEAWKEYGTPEQWGLATA